MKKEIEVPKTAREEFGEVLEKLGKHYKGIIGINDRGVYKLTPVYGGSESDKGSTSYVSGYEEIPLQLTRGEYFENYFRYSFVARHLRWLMGEVLTIIDATIDDERKLKATKDLVKDKFSSKMDWIYQQAGTPEDEESSVGVEAD